MWTSLPYICLLRSLVDYTIIMYWLRIEQSWLPRAFV